MVGDLLTPAAKVLRKRPRYAWRSPLGDLATTNLAASTLPFSLSAGEANVRVCKSMMGGGTGVSEDFLDG